ncbi:Amidinotransferase family protein [Trichomonas vaginalis G3]|uniref:Amidinotransferase family protein n=1 Tax=Trichomonas vaginalis (strain ATCC PRA-98 / G3) TaxID=412133 RepID=A2E0M2_TRIV3|nr:amidinotransferase family [Trichomonas vaginalis G3]EAY13767.1 Amidinotransferase family protein [Trichomonas vaginalis G3]KAI5542717.1 amidinotransferase family [Trichomonas vaginalis G3]|eukprot:XP_001325990.1 Amidinotransferase family protein [Trichomonas vaginalis G3]
MLASISRASSSFRFPLVKSFNQVSEFDHPTDIITHCPGIETRFPFHLSAFLYEHPPNPKKAVGCHNEFRKLLHEACGARIWTVREILKNMETSELRKALVNFTPVHFSLTPGIPSADTQTKLKQEYLDFSLSKLSKDHLIDLIFLHPTLIIDVNDKSSTGFHYDKIPLSPLANTVFTRDQQITTAKGVVIGRFGAAQRRDENDLMSIVWPQIGVNPVGRIEAPGTIEGGDFIPLSKDCMLLGVGLRTNMNAAQQLMDKDLLGCDRFVVVEDKVDCNQQRMHLDTFFNVASEKLCVCVDKIAQDDPQYVRIAHEYVKREEGYVEEKTMPFGQWLKKEKFEVVEATFKQQEDYFINLLHLGKTPLGKDRVFAINPEVEKALVQHGYDGHVYYMDFSQITAMYGGAHCATQVLRSQK